MMPYLLPQPERHGPGGDQSAGRSAAGPGGARPRLLQTIRDSGYRGPIGILGHTMDDAEARLKDNLDGLDWLVPSSRQVPLARPETANARSPGPARESAEGPTPIPRTPRLPFDPELVAGSSPRPSQTATHRGAQTFFVVTEFRMHLVSSSGQPKGGSVGPDLTTVGLCTLRTDCRVDALAATKGQGGILGGRCRHHATERLDARIQVEDEWERAVLREVPTGAVRIAHERYRRNQGRG